MNDNTMPTSERNQIGFTLVELMVTLTVAAILLATAAPSFTDFIRGQAVKTAAFDLVAALAYARSEAIKRNASVEITPVSSDWKNGWETSASTGTPPASLTLDKQSAFENSVAITSGAAKITYGGDGRLVAASGPSFEISAGSNASCVQISLSGMPTSRKGSCS